MEEEAKRRKERLQQWKTTKQSQITKRKEYEDDDEEQPAKNDEEQQEQIEFPKPIFRNYKPRDAGPLQGAIVLPKPKLIDIKSLVILHDEISFLEFDSVFLQIDEKLKDTSAEKENASMKTLSEDVDLLSLAPRKPDSDLKRDVEKKLKKLEKRTTRAIAELTRERLLNEQDKSQTSLAEVVATTSKLNQDDEDED